MAITFIEATTALLSGKPLQWAKFQDHKAGSVLLDEPGQRRLFEYLLSQDAAKVAQGSDDLFNGLLAAWDKDADPAAGIEADDAASDNSSWRLQHIEASGFGGLTTHGGQPFKLWTAGNNWCLEGQNGSGKTSLASAIIWALTGKRLRDQDGLIDERGARAPVHNADGKSIGSWPPIVCYPLLPDDLNSAAHAWVKLTFVNEAGETAVAFRSVVSSPGTDPVHEHEIDPRLLASPQMIETGLLMPARLPSIGFGERSKSLYEAVKMLTGLDQLSDIAEGSAAFTNSGRRFLKYAKDNNVDLNAGRFADQMAQASKLALELSIELPATTAIDTKDLPATLKELAKSALDSAGSQASTLATEFPESIKIQSAEGRDRVRRAVATARTLLDQGAKGVELFQAWKSLTDWHEANAVNSVIADLDAADLALAKALTWHDRQTEDKKLRLKAVAAHLYSATDSDCPLCETSLATESHKALAKELVELQQDAEAAERKLDDACLAIGRDIAKNVPPAVRQYADFLAKAPPKDAYKEAVLARFSNEAPFSDVLIGLAKYAREVVEVQVPTLPAFGVVEFQPAAGDLEVIRALKEQIHSLRQLAALAEWWTSHKAAYAGAWNTLVGRPDPEGKFPVVSLQARLEVLEDALAKAEPLDALSKALSAAATECEKWQTIQVSQKKREDVAAALEPLKQLKALVNAETASSISGLSGKIKDVLDRIHLRERLDYQATSLGKKAVNVAGSFAEGLHIDAALVANTSWLRAILWAFVFALRDETIAKLGRNPFPLMVLDDPQATFDPRNKRKWAEEVVALANLARSEPRCAQVFLTTHERQFYQIVADVEKLDGELGIIGGVNKSSGVATIMNGGCLLHLYSQATENSDDAKARDYMNAIRVYCEGLLKIMLRSEGPQTATMSVDALNTLMKQLREAHVAPFDRKPFETLINTLSEGSKPMGLINHVHHNADETVGVAEATDVKEFWESRLRKDIHRAFQIYDSFTAFTGDPRTFPWANNVVAFPSGHKAELKSLKMQQTGIAAAAKTDGVAGDGIITVEEWEAGTAVTLPNHEAYQLAAGTLDPVAGIGDVLIVSNYAKVNPRNLVVAAHDGSLLARRFSKPDGHSEIEVLTGQSTDPYALPNPILVVPESREYKKVVGTLFVSHQLPIPPKDDTREVVPLDDFSVVEKALGDARLFKVQGRSAEPIALNDQFLVTRDPVSTVEKIKALDGRLVVAFDENGARYFKRLRCHGNVAALESLNPDGTASSELLSFDGSAGHPRITHALEVVGVLFELPAHLQHTNGTSGDDQEAG